MNTSDLVDPASTCGTTTIPASIETSYDSTNIQSLSFSQRCVESLVSPLDSRCFDTTIMASGQTFQNAVKFHDAIYLMSLARKFCYRFKRNSAKHMTVVCTVDGCPWKITGHAIGAIDVAQVHTFQNHHNHSIEDVASSQLVIRSNRALLIIDNVIRSTPDYQP